MVALLFLAGVLVGLVFQGVWTFCIDLLSIYREEQ